MLQFVSNDLESISLIKNGRGLLEEEIRVDYNTAKYNMKETKETRDMIERLWGERTKSNARIFNASKFRLAGHVMSEEEGLLELRVGITDYKDHVGTNLSPDVQKFIGQGDDKVKRVTSPDLSSSVWANCISV